MREIDRRGGVQRRKQREVVKVGKRERIKRERWRETLKGRKREVEKVGQRERMKRK